MTPNLQKFFIKYTTLASLCGLLAWITALINGALTIRDAAVNSQFVTKIGPFSLNELTKIPGEEGFTIRLSFLGGITGYVLSCLAIGVLIGFTIFMVNKNKAH